jgi:hypothetical protein
MLVLPVLFSGILTACQPCQPWQARGAGHPPPHRGVGTGAGTSGSAGSGTASGSAAPYGGETAGIARWQEMCAQSRRIMSAPTPEARQAMMEQAMPDIAPEMRERHLEMMRKGCQ